MLIGAAYIRVSTDDQLEFSPDAQKHAIFQYAKNNDILINPEYIFVDEGISGRKAEKRPAFLRMIATAKSKPRPFDVILVHKFDRFARSREDSVVYKSMLRKDCGIKVISITEQFEDDKFSIILEAMLEAMAEYYSLNLADEVKKGMFEKARRGEHIGKAPYGYDLMDKKLVPNKYESEIVKKMFHLYTNEKYSVSKITRYLNTSGIQTKYGGKWRNCTVDYILRNNVYTGQTRYNYISQDKYTPNPESDWIIAQGSHTPLISLATYNSAIEQLNSSEKLKFTSEKNQTAGTWLRHLVYCKECGNRMRVTCSNQKYYSFRCNNASSAFCSKKGAYSARRLETAVLDAIEKDLSRPSSIQFQTITQHVDNTEINLLLMQLEKIKEKVNLAKKAYFAQIDTLEEYKNNKQSLEKEKEQILNRIKEINSAGRPTPKQRIKEINDYYIALRSPTVSIDEKNIIAKQFMSRIDFDLSTKTIQINYYV